MLLHDLGTASLLIVRSRCNLGVSIAIEARVVCLVIALNNDYLLLRLCKQQESGQAHAKKTQGEDGAHQAKRNSQFLAVLVGAGRLTEKDPGDESHHSADPQQETEAQKEGGKGHGASQQGASKGGAEGNKGKSNSQTGEHTSGLEPAVADTRVVTALAGSTNPAGVVRTVDTVTPQTRG